jgi:hypothetical protein
MTSSELRQKFLDFFEKRGHKILPSASLIPNDPTLLLTIAGMVPFKPIFLNKIQPNFKRVVSVQKCVRVNDLGNVGHTARHHTFFEMLGNFSFGDYFKKEACLWGWEFLTQTIGFSPDRMWVSVHRKDQEAFEVSTNTPKSFMDMTLPWTTSPTFIFSSMFSHGSGLRRFMLKDISSLTGSQPITRISISSPLLNISSNLPILPQDISEICNNPSMPPKSIKAPKLVIFLTIPFLI